MDGAAGSLVALKEKVELEDGATDDEDDSDDESNDEDDDEDDTAELLRELEKIKRERAAEKERQVRSALRIDLQPFADGFIFYRIASRMHNQSRRGKRKLPWATLY